MSSPSSSMIAVKQRLSKEISEQVEEYLAKGNKVTILDGGRDDSNYKPVQENESYAF